MPEWRMLLEMAVYGGLVPAAAALALMVLAWSSGWPTRAAAARWGEPVALAGGLAAGQALLDVAPWHPGASWHWLIYLALLAALLEAGDAIAGLNERLRAAVTLLLAAASAAFFVPPLQHLQTQLWLWRAAVAVSFVLVWYSLALAARGIRVRWLGAFLTMVLFASAVVIEFAGFGRLSQLAGAAAGAQGGITAALWRQPEPQALPGPRWTAAVLLTGMISSGYFYGSGVSALGFALLLAAPCVWALAILATRGMPAGRWRTVICALAAVAPVVIALALGAQAWFGEESTEGW